MIKKVDRQPRAKTESILLSDGQSFALLYLNLLKKLQRTDTMQFILVLIADALVGKSLPPISHKSRLMCIRARRAHISLHNGSGN
jgi:V-ATPase subunit H